MSVCRNQDENERLRKKKRRTQSQTSETHTHTLSFRAEGEKVGWYGSEIKMLMILSKWLKKITFKTSRWCAKCANLMCVCAQWTCFDFSSVVHLSGHH